MRNVLVVDDELWACEGVASMIRRADCGFQVAGTAGNGNEAIAALEHGGIDVVFTDIRMPVMDGLELLQTMRGLQFNQPVVIISGHNEFEYARSAMRFGAADYLLKPMQRLEVQSVLRRLASELAEREAASRQPHDAGEEETIRQGRQLVHLAMEKAHRHYMDDLSITAIAGQAGFNPSYLSRLFKQETGAGFVQYVTAIRLEAAKTLLLDEPHANVAEIARQVGFWDEKHFSKMFKREVGMTPSEYRKA